MDKGEENKMKILKKIVVMFIVIMIVGSLIVGIVSV